MLFKSFWLSPIHRYNLQIINSNGKKNKEHFAQCPLKLPFLIPAYIIAAEQVNHSRELGAQIEIVSLISR